MTDSSCIARHCLTCVFSRLEHFRIPTPTFRVASASDAVQREKSRLAKAGAKVHFVHLTASIVPPSSCVT